MLQNLRENLQGWISGVIVVLISLTFVLWGIQSYLTSHISDQVKASVNGVDITKRQADNAYTRLRNQVAMQLQNRFIPTPAMLTSLKQQALEQLISESLLKQGAKQLGLYSSQTFAEQALIRLPVFLENGQFSRAKLNQTLSSMGLSQAQFLKKLEGDLLISQLRLGISNSAFELPQEKTHTIALLNQQRDIKYLTIEIPSFYSSSKPTSQAVTDYYNKHKDHFKSPEQVSLNYVTLSLKSLSDSIKPTTKQAQRYYQDNISNYQTPVQWQVAHILIPLAANADIKAQQVALKKANSILEQLNKGADFNSLAKANSADIITKNKGGVLPWFGLGIMPKLFTDAVSKLNKPGELTPVTKVSNGYEIIKLLAIKKPRTIAFTKVKSKIIQQIKNNKAQSQFAELNEQLANLTFANPDTLDIASKEMKLQVQTTSLFSRQGGDNKFTKNQKIISAAFGQDVLEQGNNSDVIPVDDTTVAVIRVNKHVEASIKPLNKVKQTIVELLTKQNATQKASALGQSLLSTIKKQQSIAKTLEKQKLTWKTKNNLKRMPLKFNPAIASLAFKTPKNTTRGTTLVNGDFIIVQVNSITNGSISELNPAQQQALAQRITHNNGIVLYQLYTQQLQKTAKIKRGA